jgi:hypothetical protein
MLEPKEGLRDFLRGYFLLKSANRAGNDPHTLETRKAAELAKMPRYYIMDQGDTMGEAVAKEMTQKNLEVVREQSERWSSGAELAVYADEYARHRFQGGLKWYRLQTRPSVAGGLEVSASKKIEVPCLFVSGEEGLGLVPEARRSGEHGTDLHRLQRRQVY